MKTNVTLNGKTFNGIERFILDNKVFRYIGGVPEGYTVIRGIRNPNGAYINIGMPVRSTDKIEISFNYDDANTAIGILLGWRVSGGAADGNQLMISKGDVSTGVTAVLGRFIAVGKAVSTTSLNGKINVFDDNDTNVSIDFSSGAIQVNNVAADVPVDTSKVFSNGSSVVNPILFGINSAGTPAGMKGFGETYLYGFSIVRNGEYVVEMIPVKKSDGTVGMYDIARDQFFGSSNANAFAE